MEIPITDTEIPASEELWNIFILTGAKPNFFPLPPTTSIREVRQRWEAHVQEVGAFLIVGCDGCRLRDDLQIAEIGEVAPGSQTVNLVAAKATAVLLQLYGGPPTATTTVGVDPSQTTAEFHQQVADTLQLAEGRVFRLLADAGPLAEFDQSLAQQGVGMQSVIQVDLGYTVDIVDEEEETIERRIVFASEDVADLWDDEEGSKRLMIGRRTMTATGDFHHALPPIYRQMTHLSLEVQTLHEVTALVNNRLSQQHMWPSNIVASCLPATASGKKLKFEGKSVSKRKSLQQMNLPNHSLLCSDTQVSVKLSNGTRRLLKLPELSTASDLAVALSSVEGTDKFVLRCGDRVLEDEELVGKVVSDGREICVERQLGLITVSLRDRCMRWRREKAVLRFSHLMASLAARGGLAVKKASRLVLQCTGCGRRLTRGREREQAVPADCCEVRSLDLEELWRPEMADVSSQGPCLIEPADCSETESPPPTSAGHRPSTRNVKIQKCCRAVAVCLQHPPELEAASEEATNAWKFRICNKFMEAGPGEEKTIDLDLPMKPNARVLDVRRIMASKFNIDESRLKMYRWVGRVNARTLTRRRRTDLVYDVFSKKKDWFGFSDLMGATFDWRDVQQREEMLLGDMSAPFPMVMQFRNFLTLSPE